MKNVHIFGAILVFISANLCLVFGDDSNSLKEADELLEIKELPNPFASLMVHYSRAKRTGNASAPKGYC